MSREIDFSNAEINRLRMYGGANGSKIGIVYEGEQYMLKFPPKPQRNPDMSYTNSCISEHVACRIFKALGMEAQETVLGMYNGKIAVACKDFERDGYVFKDFAHLKNTIIDSGHSGYGTELADVIDTIRSQQIISPAELEPFFWNMFVADALLGNFDRHNGNWGFLINESKGDVRLAPVFDCGSCLYPQMDENGMVGVMESREKIEQRLFTFPNSALKESGVKINYARFLTDLEYAGCAVALETIGGRVDLDVINAIIEDTPFISDTHKQFLRTMIKERKEQIIDRALARFRGQGQPERADNEENEDLER